MAPMAWLDAKIRIEQLTYLTSQTMPELSPTSPDVVLIAAVVLNLIVTLPTLVRIWRNLK